jgi:Tfp pilus assembly protein PilE
MIKTIGLVGILCAAAIFGLSWARQNFQTTEKAPTASLQAAATALEFTHRQTGTYAGAKTESVKLVWADQFRYCIEFGGSHIAGPGGTPTAGACPR